MSRGREAGYTYIGALALLTAAAIAAQTTWIPSEGERLRDAEEELLFRGEAYVRAIASYAVVDGRLPGELAHLLEDPRREDLRHIRRLWEPPIGEGWTLLRGEDGGIMGVAPQSDAVPRRRAFLPSGREGFAEAETYAAWEFRFER
jgi:hypothetical protein